jgi:thiol-disulfide isomerase/thioredoxin
MRLYLLELFALLIFLLGCSHPKYTLQPDEKAGKIIVGKITWDDWKKDAGWSDYSAIDYSPTDLVEFREIVNSDISFILFSGSWCGDSKSEVPKIFKLFSQAGKENKIKLYGLDRMKDEPSGIAKLYKIEKVPTLIILRDNQESGRIIEYPAISWEKDIMQIISSKQQVK